MCSAAPISCLLAVTLKGLRPCVLPLQELAVIGPWMPHLHLDQDTGSRVTRKLERGTKKGPTIKAEVAASNPLVDANTSLGITSGLCTLSGSSSIQKRHLGTANLRYVQMLLIFIAL
jgi:hypothetical protein